MKITIDFEDDEIWEAADANQISLNVLEKKNSYRDLTIEEIRTTCTFLPDRYQPKDMLDLKFGDWLLINKH